MKDILKYIISGLIAVSLFYFITLYIDKNNEEEQLMAETELIEKQINNVSKLVVTEMKYGKVYNYENTKSYSWDFFSSQKSALIISNATAQISYDLKKMKYEISAQEKTITIKYIPQPEISIDPNLTFYKMDNGLLNRFEGKDYNTINRKVKNDLKKEIEQDQVIKNAQNRLLSELSSIYILSNSMGWKLVYKEIQINSTSKMDGFLL
jgi:hypothetical protein